VQTPVLEKYTNQPAIALSCFLSRLPCAALTTLVSTRESILFRVPPFSQCFRGGKSATNNSADADFTKLQRSACAGSNYGWIMWGWVAEGARKKWDVVECGWD